MHKLIIIPYSGDELNAEDLLATNKISRPSAVRLLKKYSEQLSRCCLPAAAVTELSVGITDDGITLEGKGFGNETVAGLIKGCDSVWLYHVTSGTELENAECFDSASMRDMFAFAAMLKMNKELNEYFRRDIGLSSPENLLAACSLFSGGTVSGLDCINSTAARDCFFCIVREQCLDHLYFGLVFIG